MTVGRLGHAQSSAAWTWLFYVAFNNLWAVEKLGVSSKSVQHRWWNNFQKMHRLQPKDAQLDHLWYAAQSMLCPAWESHHPTRLKLWSSSLIHICIYVCVYIYICIYIYNRFSSLLGPIKLTLACPEQWSGRPVAHGPMAPLLPLTWCRSAVVRVTIFGRAYYLGWGMASRFNHCEALKGCQL